MTTRLMHIFCVGFLLINSAFAQEERPFFNEVQPIDFGELLGLAGTCILNYDSGLITDGGGSLCPFPNTRFGDPGRYQIVATPFTNVQIMVDRRPNTGDGISYTPAGIYQVFGESDTPIIADLNQTIYSGSTGVITIFLGGTLVSSVAQSFNSSFSISIVDGITFNEVP
ncbi:hypothetical protein [uncultured Paraglaciecola sp.]|uniref:hypothetical protein n=1 Tax=uncultured Paraglaciecola sp. TaxID=1765024 RepID=UPI0025FA7855|nr:hypothetical protein [uncultured Paraglaciecola sp.]